MPAPAAHPEDPSESGPQQVPGLELSRQLYEEAVRPLLEASYPKMPYAAAVLGRGSEVLGYDDAMSTDHDWNARLLLFLSDHDHARSGASVEAAIRRELADGFHEQPLDLRVVTVREYFRRHLDVDVTTEIEARDWLTLPEQRLLMVTSGAVFHDEVGLEAVRSRLAYYPRDVWLYLLAAGWWRVHPEMNLVGRTGFVGDELGSALIASRLVTDLMRLCFLMERQYAPYAKWFGTAFTRLPTSAALSPLLWRAVHAETWPDRESALNECYQRVAAQHLALGITEPVTTGTHQMWDRPFEVWWGDFPGALLAQIRDPAVLQLADRWPVGGVDQVREVLWAPQDRHLVRRLLE